MFLDIRIDTYATDECNKIGHTGNVVVKELMNNNSIKQFLGTKM